MKVEGVGLLKKSLVVKTMSGKAKWFTSLFQEGYRAVPQGITYYLFVGLALVLSAFELWLGSVGNMSPYYYSVVFLTFILPITLLTTRSTKKASANPSVMDYIFAVLTLLSGAYIVINVKSFLTRISGVDPLSNIDLAAAFVLLAAVLELTRRTLGFGLTALLLIGIGYAFLGHLIPGTFGHRSVTLERFLEEMVFTANGIFGSPVQVAATYAFLFIAFGHFFQAAGAGQFIFDICAVFMGRRVGGLAKVAVSSAGVFGSISGSPSADVATTGSINIPMMKKRGYSPVFAGGVEAAAASGGTILPPIMGSVAFLMAEFTGIAYVDIAIATILCAVLYYVGIYMQVHFRSLKLNLVGMDDKDIPDFWKTFKSGFYYVFPIIILIWAMHKGFTPSLAACYGIAAIFIFSFVRRSTWITPKHLVEIFTSVVYSIAPLTVATAAAGIIIGVINLTGMAGKFTSLIFTLTGGSILLSLIVSAMICIVLGMGMPTPSVYVLVAALVAPALMQLGLELLPVHLFLVFFAALSAITPPVGVAAFTAAGIANANPLSIGIQASKLAFVGFVIPFMFVYQPSLLLQGDVGMIIFTAITALFGVYALAAAFEGYLISQLNLVERILLLISGLTMIYPDITLNAIAAIGIAVIYIRSRNQVKHQVKVKAGTEEQPVALTHSR